MKQPKTSTQTNPYGQSVSQSKIYIEDAESTDSIVEFQQSIDLSKV